MGLWFVDMSALYAADLEAHYYNKQMEKRANSHKSIERRGKGLFAKLFKKLRKKQTPPQK